MNKRTDTSYITIAEKLGVSYNHLYRVLHCLRQSASLILTIERLYPELISRQDPFIKRSLMITCDFYRSSYKWNAKQKRFTPKK